MMVLTHASFARDFNVVDFGARGDGVTDNCVSFQAAIDAAIKAGPGNRVFIPHGRFVLAGKPTDNGAYINILKADHLTISGEDGSVILARTPRRNIFYFWGSRNLTLKNLVLQRSTRMFSQMTVNQVDVQARTVVVTIEPGYDQLDAPNIADTALLVVFSDPLSGSWGDHGRDCGFFAPGDRGTCWPPTAMKRKRLSANSWELTLNTAPQTNYVGAKAVLWVTHGGGSAILATASQDVLVDHVAYYAAGADSGFYLAGNTGPFTFKHFVMDAPPGSDDLVAAAGGSYVLNNHTALTLDNTRIVKVWDDAVNVGANFAHVYDQASSDELDVDGSRGDFAVSDKVEVWDWTYHHQHVRGSARIVDVTRREEPGKNIFRLTLDRDIQGGPTGQTATGMAPVHDGLDRIIDVDSAGSLTVNNSEFQSFHSHGILFRASNTKITNSLFRDTIGPGIQTGPDFAAEEGPAAKNIVISGNTFHNVSSSNVVLGPTNEGGPSDVECDIENILISENAFQKFGRYIQGAVGEPNAAVYIRNARHVQIARNSFDPFHSSAVSLPHIDCALSSDVESDVSMRLSGGPSADVGRRLLSKCSLKKDR